MTNKMTSQSVLLGSISSKAQEQGAQGVRTGLRAQVQCFGLAMVKLDIRQESSRHADVLDTITRYLGLGSYK